MTPEKRDGILNILYEKYCNLYRSLFHVYDRLLLLGEARSFFFCFHEKIEALYDIKRKPVSPLKQTGFFVLYLNNLNQGNRNVLRSSKRLAEFGCLFQGLPHATGAPRVLPVENRGEPRRCIAQGIEEGAGGTARPGSRGGEIAPRSPCHVRLELVPGLSWAHRSVAKSVRQ